MLFKHIDGVLCAAHVASFRYKFASLRDQSFRLFTADLILCRARQGYIDLLNMLPWPLSLDVLEFVLVAVGGHELGELFALHLEVGDVGDVFGGDALIGGGDYGAFAVGEGDDGGAEFNSFERGVLGYIAGAGDGYLFAFEGFGAAGGVLDHVVHVLQAEISEMASVVRGWEGGEMYVNETVSCSFRSYQATTKCSTLAGQAAFPECSLSLVGAEQPSDLSGRDTDIASRYIGIGADVLAQFSHESHAKLADLVV